MRGRILLVAMGAAVLLVAASFAIRSRDGTDRFWPLTRIPSPAPAPTRTEPAVSPPAAELSDSRPLPSLPVPVVAPEAGDDSRLPAELAEAVAHYRAAKDREERERILLELALTDEPESLSFLLDELGRGDPEDRESVLSAIVQLGSRDAVPHLRELALAASSQDEAQRLTEAADYLELPSLTELRGELQDRWHIGHSWFILGGESGLEFRACA